MIPFIRKDGCRIDQLAVIQFTHDEKLKTAAAVLEAFERGITDWVESTVRGKKAWDYSSEDLNIGDMLGEEENEDLNSRLRREGISIWRCSYQLSEEEEVSYDKILATPEGLED